MRVISRAWKRGADRPLVVDLRVVFIDISGGVAACTYVHTGSCACLRRVCTCVWSTPLGQEGVQHEWLGWCMAQRAIVTSCSHLLELPPSCPRSDLLSSLLPPPPRVSPSSTFSPFTIATCLASPRSGFKPLSLFAISVTISTRAGFSTAGNFASNCAFRSLSYPIESHLRMKGKIASYNRAFQKMRNVGKNSRIFLDYYMFYFVIKGEDIYIYIYGSLKYMYFLNFSFPYVHLFAFSS